MWDWLVATPIIDSSNPEEWRVYDGADIGNNCSEPNNAQYSYNYGILIGGLAYMYNHVRLRRQCNECNFLLTICRPKMRNGWHHSLA